MCLAYSIRSVHALSAKRLLGSRYGQVKLSLTLIEQEFELGPLGGHQPETQRLGPDFTWLGESCHKIEGLGELQ